MKSHFIKVKQRTDMLSPIGRLSNTGCMLAAKTPHILTTLAGSSLTRLYSETKLNADRITSTSHPLVASNPTLSHEMLASVISGEKLACVVPRFTPQDTCRELTERLLGISGYEHYDYAPGVGRIGFSYSETNTKEAHERYYNQARTTMEDIRSSCGDLPSPIDMFRLRLQEAWNYGANFEMLDDGEKMFVGLGRMIEAKQCIKPHQDMIQWYAGYSKASLRIQVPLTMNIYLEVPEEGGELELWNWGYESEADYKALAKDSYGIDKKDLPPPNLVIKPQLGDLIIFNPGKLHCIATGSGNRFTVSSFMGYHGPKAPLTWWS